METAFSAPSGICQRPHGTVAKRGNAVQAIIDAGGVLSAQAFFSAITASNLVLSVLCFIESMRALSSRNSSMASLCSTPECFIRTSSASDWAATIILAGRVASRRNVTRLVVVVLPFLSF